MQPEITIPLPLRPAGQVPPPGPLKSNAFLRKGCPHIPGSAERLDTLMARARAGLPLFRDDDLKSLPDNMGYLPVEHLDVISAGKAGTGAAVVVKIAAGGELKQVGRSKKQPSRARQLTAGALHKPRGKRGNGSYRERREAA